ncbi:MAG: DUF2147 domain-containing protein [Spirochaetaceae bacterium]|jgi:uncharacterized protein (DUF2147 family)|nr:DUF2147 domain-containing protein [Spirochaetaceae bacterium]
MKQKLIVLFLLLSISFLFAAEDVTGLWVSIDDETGDPSSISILYMYQGQLFGRIIITYDDENPGVVKDTYLAPGDRAELLVGDPYYAGLDFIWGLEDRGRRWGRGRIMDPKKGKIYNSEIWLEDGDLILRGKIGPIGRNQTWFSVDSSDLPAGFVIPDSSSLVPRIPQLK